MTINSTMKGNLLSVTDGIIVHGCNCHGAMGAGVAKSIRDKWPDAYTAYREHRSKVGLRLGDVNFVASTAFLESEAEDHVHTFTSQMPPGLILANAMTQQTFGGDPSVRYVSYAAISATFSRVALVARETGKSVHFPLIGCGLANGNWNEVEPLINAALGDVEGILWIL